MLIDLVFETTKFIVQQFKTNPNNIQFQKLEPGQHCSFSDEWWDYWVFDTYQDMVAWTEQNKPEYVNRIPEEQDM